MWVEEEESDGLARALGATREEFEQRYLREVPDPNTGELRLSLMEGPGHAGGSGDSCALLVDGHHCTVYESRPRHCREYPFWPSILRDAESFEAARATCPGITPLPAPEVRARAFAELEALYRELDLEVDSHSPRCEMSGVCCRFEEAGHELFATALETDYTEHRHPTAPAPEAKGRCPYHVRGTCTARAGRPLGCRTYFCDPLTETALQELHEVFLARVRKIERTTGYPASYGPFPAQLRARGVGVQEEPS